MTLNNFLRDDITGLRPSDQLQQSYATLRGRKWSEKNCRGIGDNYGRHVANLNNFTDDARSVQSLADDFILPAAVTNTTGTISRRSAMVQQQQQQQQHQQQHNHHIKNLSRYSK